MIRVFIPLILVFSWLVPAEDHIYFDKTVQKKFTAAIFNAYGTADYSLINVRDSTVLIPTGETACLNHTYRVYHADTLLGYARFESGMGRYEPFDFVVLYNPNRIIRQVEILVYRSDHGFEIMNKRWLAQFQGTHGCGLIYGKDIDAISGATLSAASLTETIAGICETMQLHPIFEND